MRRKLIAFLVCSVAYGPVYADDLVSIYRDALASDPQYASQRSQYEATKERKVQARALLLPNINANGNVNYNNTNQTYGYNPSTNALNGQRDYGSYGAGLNLTQPIYRPQNRVTYEQSGIQVDQGESQLSQAGQDLMVRTAQAYFDVLLAQFELLTVQAQKAATAEQLAQAKRNFEVGTATITDTYDAQARYDLIVAGELSATNDIAVRQQALRQIIGRVPGVLNNLGGPVTLNPPVPNDMEKWVEAAYASSQQVQIAKYNVELSEKEVQKNNFGHYPTLDAVANLNYAYQSSSPFNVNQTTNAAVIGLQLNVPIYSGGAISARVREAIANRSKAQDDYETARRQVAQNTRQAFLAVNTGLSQINALQQAVASNKLSVEASKLGQEVGVRTQVDVLNAQGLLFGAERDLARAYYQTIMGQLRLKSSVGRLTEADIDNINRLLSPPGTRPAPDLSVPNNRALPVPQAIPAVPPGSQAVPPTPAPDAAPATPAAKPQKSTKPKKPQQQPPQ